MAKVRKKKRQAFVWLSASSLAETVLLCPQARPAGRKEQIDQRERHIRWAYCLLISLNMNEVNLSRRLHNDVGVPIQGKMPVINQLSQQIANKTTKWWRRSKVSVEIKNQLRKAVYLGGRCQLYLRKIHTTLPTNTSGAKKKWRKRGKKK